MNNIYDDSGNNNAPDYENYNDNLAFEPKSADDLNEQGRQSDVLITAIERCERLEKQLKIAVKYLKIICDDYSCSTCMSCLGSAFAKTALGKIEELDK